MDAPETPAERQARQFAQLRCIGDRTMILADVSFKAAMDEIEHPPEPTPQPALKPAPRRPDLAKAFLQAASGVRQNIALELRVEAGPPVRRFLDRTPAAPPKPDPRRPMLQKVLHDAVRNDPNRARRRLDIDKCIEEEILADPDPDNAAPIAETLHTICTKLCIDIELARVPDAFLDFDEPIKTLTRDKSRKPDS